MSRYTMSSTAMEGPDDSQVVEQDVEKLNQGLRQRRTPDELRADLIKEEEDIQNVTATVGKRLSISKILIISDLRMTIFDRI